MRVYPCLVADGEFVGACGTLRGKAVQTGSHQCGAGVTTASCTPLASKFAGWP